MRVCDSDWSNYADYSTIYTYVGGGWNMAVSDILLNNIQVTDKKRDQFLKMRTLTIYHFPYLSIIMRQMYKKKNN